MTDDIRVTSPVAIESDAKSRVAYDLMELISAHESKEVERRAREYWLKLYSQCYKATSGQQLKYVLNADA